MFSPFEDFFDYVKGKFTLTPVENSAINYVMDSIAMYDVEFTNEQLNEIVDYGDLNSKSITEMVEETTGGYYCNLPCI